MFHLPLKRYLGAALAILAMLPTLSAQAQTDTTARGVALQAKLAAAGNTSAIVSSTRVQVSTRVGMIGGSFSPNTSDGTVASATYRNYTPIANGTYSDLIFSFPNWRYDVSGFVTGANNITVKAALECGNALYPIFFGGHRTATIEPGGTLDSDALHASISGPTDCYTRVYVTNAGVTNGTWPLGRKAWRTFVELGESNTYNLAPSDKTDICCFISGSTLSGAGGFQYGPISITGTPLQKTRAVAIVGDSISVGFGDSFANPAVPFFGFIERGLGNSVAWATLTRSSGTFGNALAAQQYGVGSLGNSTNSAIVEYGTNDIFGGASLSVVQSTAVRMWTLLAARGNDVYQTTIVPRTSSTDGFASVGGQSSANATAEPIRVGYNGWLRDGAPILNGVAVATGSNAVGTIRAGQVGHPLRAYIEVASLVENAGMWSAPTSQRTISDAAINASTNMYQLTSASANFSAADIGKGITIAGAGPSGTLLVTFIATVVNSTTVTINDGGITVTGAVAKIGTYTADGIHPNPQGAGVMSAAISTAVSSGLIRAKPVQN